MYQQAETSWNWFYFNDIQLWQFSFQAFERNSPFWSRVFMFCFSANAMPGYSSNQKKILEHLHIGNI